MLRNQIKTNLDPIKQQDQKQPIPMLPLLPPLPPTSPQILLQLQNFHKYYNDRHQHQLQLYTKLKQQNSEYAGKIIQYEQMLRNYENMLREGREEAVFLGRKMRDMREEWRREVGELEGVVGELREEIGRVRGKYEVPKKKVIRLKQKPNRQQDETTNLESARSNHQLSTLKNQLQLSTLQTAQLTRQNQLLRNKIKHLEADRKYEDERIKNATLALELDLKIKCEQVQRLQYQVEVYQRKFQEVLGRGRNGWGEGEEGVGGIGDFQRESGDSRFQENWRGIEVGSKPTQQRQCQKTHRKLQLDPPHNPTPQNLTTNKTKTHKRHTSSNLQQHRKQNKKQELNLKIKIFKYSKNKKYI